MEGVELEFSIRGNNKEAVASIQKVIDAMAQLDDTAKKTGVSVDGVVGSVGRLDAVMKSAFSVAALSAFAKKVYDVRSSMQDLESTMRVFLGSAEKAAKFTNELRDYAYWNMFEFSDLAQASTQLLAYGHAADDIIPILDKLSNVATGTKKPLEMYVDMYNRAKSTGLVDGRAVRQWAASGVILKDELKKMGIEATGASITFKQLDAVINQITSDGAQFGGLMMSQMDNLSASFGQLQDGITNALNAIGERYQDVFKGAIDKANELVENYEQIGKIVLTIVAVYGEYKAALLITNALQAVHSAHLVRNTALFVKYAGSMGLAAAAQKAFNVAVSMNPYVFAATALIAVATAAYGAVKAFKDDRDAVEKLNEAYDENVRNIENEVRLGNEEIRTLKDKTASTYAYIAAREKLAGMEAFAEYSASDLATMTPEQIEKILKNWGEQQQKKALQDKQSGLVKEIQANAANYIRFSTQAMSSRDGSGDKAYGQKYASQALEDLKKSDDALAATRIEAWSSKTLSEQQRNAQAYVDMTQKNIDANQAIIDKLTEKGELSKQEQEDLARAQLQVERMTHLNNIYAKSLREINAEMEKTDPKDVGQSVSETITAIKQQEKEVERLKKEYAKNDSDNNKEALEGAKSDLKALTDSYERATGKTWASVKQRTDNVLNAIKSEELAAAQFDASREQDKYEKLRKERDAELLKLKQSNEQYKKSNNGASDPTYEQQMARVKAKYEKDLADMKREFEDWRKDIARQRVSVTLDIDMKAAERKVEQAVGFGARSDARKELRDVEDDKRGKDRAAEREAKLLPLLANDTEKLAAVLKGDFSGLSEELANEVSGIIDSYEALWLEQDKLTTQTRAFEDMDDYVNTYTDFMERIVEAEEWKAEQLQQIRNGESDKSAGQIESTYNSMVGDAEKDSGFSINDGIVKSVAELEQKIANASFESVQAAVTALNDAITLQIGDIDAKMAEQQELLEGETDEEKKAEIASRLNDLQQKRLVLLAAQNKVQDMGIKKMQNADRKIVKNTQELQRKCSKTADSFDKIKNIADSVAETFGDKLSKKGAKALDVISEMASFGANTIRTIGDTAQVVTKGIEAASQATSASIKAAEQSTVILAIIEAVMAVIQGLVKIATKFSKSNLMQEHIDELTESVDRLKRKHEELERSYQNDVGTTYYKNLARAARDYSTIITQQKVALSEAQKLYEYLSEHYNSNSKKVKEAREQVEALTDDLWDLQDAQAEQYQQLLEDLSGTNLQSFSENLASTLVDAFADGATSIEDVWEDTLDNMLKTMLQNQLALALSNMFQGVFDSLNSKTKDGELTQAEMDEIIAEFNAKTAEAERLAKSYYDIMNERGLFDDRDAQGTQGFGQMTQDTAEELNARFTALQIEGANVVASAQELVTLCRGVADDSRLNSTSLQSLVFNSNIGLQIAQEQLEQMQTIASHTAMLEETNTRLRSIEQNTSML